MTDKKKADSDFTEKPASAEAADIPAESAEMARLFWSSLREDCRRRAETKHHEQAKDKAVADEALEAIDKIKSRATKSAEESAGTSNNLRTHGVIHFPKDNCR
jgi:hypothetical protein